MHSSRNDDKCPKGAASSTEIVAFLNYKNSSPKFCSLLLAIKQLWTIFQQNLCLIWNNSCCRFW